jgi:hypothetical protein
VIGVIYALLFIYAVGYIYDHWRNQVIILGGLLPTIGWRAVYPQPHVRVQGLWIMWLWKGKVFAPRITIDFGDGK